MRVPVSRELDLLVEDTMKPSLAQFGFSRRGDDFLREAEDDLVQVVSLWRYRYSTDIAGPLDWIALELGLGMFEQAKITWKTMLPDREDVRTQAKDLFGIDLAAS